MESARPDPTPGLTRTGGPALWESRWVWSALLLIGAAVICRQYLGAVSYWYDEAYLLLNVFHRPWDRLLGAIDYAVPAPPLYLWAARAAYLTLGPSELAMRLPAVLAGILALALMAPLARRLVGGAGWPWALAFFALSAHVVQHSCEVHPYSFDLLASVSALLAACCWIVPGVGARGRLIAAGALFVVAVVAPWMSFPSAFVLGSVGLALFGDAFRRRTRDAWAVAAAFNGLMLLSAAALWYWDVRTLHYDGLRESWASGYPGAYTPAGLLRWAIATPVSVGDYATQSMGVPLFLLAVVGAYAQAKRCWPLVVLTAGPIVLGMAASFLRQYPMNNRLLMYAVPCIWLLAAAGVGTILQRLGGRARWAAAAACGTLLLPGAAETAREIAVATPRMDYRAAFAYVHRHEAPEDKVWATFGVVYEAYFGEPDDYLGRVGAEEVAGWVAKGRVWVVLPHESPLATDTLRRLQDAGYEPADLYRVNQVDVYLFAPSRRTAGG